MDLCQCDWLGFDVDHTLVRYKVPALTELIHTAFVSFLAEHRGYSRDAFSSLPDQSFFAKGLLFDAATGNFMHVLADGTILAAAHGTKTISVSQAERMYRAVAQRSLPPRQQVQVGRVNGKQGEDNGDREDNKEDKEDKEDEAQLPHKRAHVAHHLQPVRRGVQHRREAKTTLARESLAAICSSLLADGVKHPRFFYFSTFFDMPGAAILAQAIDATDAKRHHDATATEGRGAPQREQGTEGQAEMGQQQQQEGEHDGIPRHWLAGGYEHVLQDMKDGLDFNFDAAKFGAGGGFFFPVLKQQPETYIHRASQQLVDWLEGMRAKGARLFLLTNSHVDFASFLLTFAFGKVSHTDTRSLALTCNCIHTPSLTPSSLAPSLTPSLLPPPLYSHSHALTRTCVCAGL